MGFFNMDPCVTPPWCQQWVLNYLNERLPHFVTFCISSSALVFVISFNPEFSSIVYAEFMYLPTTYIFHKKLFFLMWTIFNASLNLLQYCFWVSFYLCFDFLTASCVGSWLPHQGSKLAPPELEGEVLSI